MSLILVVEKDADFQSQLEAALRAGGHDVDLASSCAEGERKAQQRRPHLVLASGMLPGAPQLLGNFSKRNGGPGAAVIVPAQMAGELSAPQFGADVLLLKPMGPGALTDVFGLLPGPPKAQASPPPSDPALLPNVGAQLTSEQIFGDVLAEVEADVERRLTGGPTAAASTQPPPAPQVPAPRRHTGPPAAAAPPAPQAPAAPTPSPSQPPPPRKRRSAHDDIDRKLEETLSGFFPDKLRAASAPPESAKPSPKPRRAAAPSANEIDDLLDKTLSSLELPKAKKARRDAPVAPAAPRPQPPSVQTQASQPPATSTPPPSPPAPAEATFTPPPIAPGPPADLPSAAQTMRLDVPAGDTFAPPPPPATPATPEPPAAPEPWTPDTTSEEELLRTGTFDLPALEPLPDPAASAPVAPTSFSAPQFPPEPAAAETPGGAAPFAPPEPTAPSDPFSALEIPAAPPSFEPPSLTPLEPSAAPAPAPIEDSVAPPATGDDGYHPTVEIPGARDFQPPTLPTESTPAAAPPAALPDIPPADGWSVSSYGAPPTPPAPASASTPSFPAIEDSAYPATFDSPSFASTPEAPTTPPSPPAPSSGDSAYPSDFESAFALPAPSEDDEGGQLAFSPDPTETVEPEDTASLQKTLEGVLQIRNGAASTSKAGIAFGDYRLLERVAVGGMAEVWRAQRRGVEGFQKIVAIKKILSHLTGSQDFVTMFIDEAKLAAQLNHANIIQIYDLGKVEDDFFIAMEFVDGKDLRSIQNQAKENNETLPLGLCLMITAALARALDYAHRKRDFDNRELGLVHRDVSPQNVLISYEGEIKLCDFGIVKAVAKASSTQMGALKGKLQYMSPEQAWGKEVDARSDIFSLGSVFFELLTGQRLFTGDSEIGVLDAVRDCRVQSPRNLNPEVPVEVEAIVMRALAATPETRYQTAGDMEKDIAAAIEQLRLGAAQSDLAGVMARLFGNPVTAGGGPAEPSFADPVTPPETPAAPASPEPAPAPPQATPAATKPAAKDAGKSGGSRTWLIAAIVLLALAAVVGVLVVQLKDDPAPAAIPATTPAATPATVTPAAPTEAPAAADGEATAEGEAPAEGVAPEAEAAESPDSASGADAEAADGQPEASSPSAPQDAAAVEQMIQDAVNSQKQKLEEDFEAQKRELEAELRRVRESGGTGDGGGGGNS
ncbi:MAG: protein kinase [Acidobacteriota bacterium]